MSIITESFSVSINYRPSWSYATRAVSWLKKAPSSPNPPHHYGDESVFLSLLYSALSLEALIDQCLTDYSRRDNSDLFRRNISLARRWHDGAARLLSPSDKSLASLLQVQTSCNDHGDLGLLFRARNKLVHPRAFSEVIDDRGHDIQDGPIENLVNDLKARGLPNTNPAFPLIVQSLQSAHWATQTMKSLTLAIYEVMERKLDDHWQGTLDEI